MPKDKFITYGTSNFTAQTDAGIMDYLQHWLDTTKVDDWFYKVDYRGKTYFIVDNGECGYTAMMPEDY